METVSDPLFGTLTRTSFGAGAAINDTGYHIGDNSNPETPDEPGTIVSLNFTSTTWTSEPLAGLGRFGLIGSHRIVTIPAFGLNDRGLLIVVLGGVDVGIDSQPSQLRPFDNITIYDP